MKSLQPVRGYRHPRSAVVTAWLAVSLIGGAAVGCGGRADVGRVSGVVTLDGTPLPGARVTFQPTTGGAPSHALTDASGRYELQYARGVAGARIGEHEVSISTLDRGNPDADPPRRGRPEQVPPHYNQRTTLTASVRPGTTQVDFQLTVSTARKPDNRLR
ncbi:MAG: carboxypeptidase regulatory-like domain-containing protein [Planctomycetia bacterium]|nr:carboxypeptidase regulatory-like domain-containing protein [Planctomycetia bacterium]